MPPKSLLRVLFSGVSIFLINILAAQQTPPAAYSGDINVNYVRTWDPVKPETDPNNLITTSAVNTTRMTTQYFDGLGRLLQVVNKQGSMATGDTARDMVAPVVYDEFGREVYKYLPFAANNMGGNNHITDGLFKLNPFQQQEAFMDQQYGSQGETYFYGETVFEASPLNRVMKTMAPGDSWIGADRGIEMNYWINTTADSVYIWDVSDVTGAFGAYDTSGLYPAGELYKNVTADEHGKQVVEFKDKEGKVILKKVQLTAAADTGTGKGYDGWLCTYYIYDDLNNLRCVIQPEGVKQLAAGSWQLTTTLLNEQCFRYEYDKRNRMVMKKVPGAGPVWMVYDARDRLVLTQDSVMRSNYQWLYTQYDGLNRPVASGIFTDNNNLSYHSQRADTSIAYPWPGVYTIDTLTKTFYDDYTWRNGQGNPLSATRNNSYDSYLQTPSNTAWPFPQSATTQSSDLKGMITGTKVKVLGTSTYLYTVNFYDDKGRMIQMQSSNITGSTDIATTQYSWNGQPLLTIQKQDKASPNQQTIVALTKLTYDSLWRISQVDKKISHSQVDGGDMPDDWTTILINEYDALGQLKKKQLAPEYAEGDGLDSLVYDYNIRGWMLGMNRSYIKDTTSTSNYFGFDLGYDKTDFTVNGNTRSYAAAQYNGNIEGMLWKSTGDDQLRKYDFTYDAANRVLSADFNQLTNNSFSKAAGIDFSMYGMSYDANGNILTMNQKGWKITGSETIDSLLYTYTAYSNKLLNVIDRENDTATRLGDFRSSELYMNNLSQDKTTEATDYTYDGNGNMNLDNNKDISFIHYNYLNLPDSIVVANKGHITYTYDAAGTKLKKTTTEGAKVTTTLYLFGNFVNDTLQYLPQEEGRVRFKQSDNTLQYDYFIKDHLGNIRMVLTEEKDTSAYVPVAFEDASTGNEQVYYENADDQRTNRPGSFYSSGTNGDKVQLLRQTTQAIGAGKLLKVMARDRLHIKVDYYIPNDATDNSGADGISSLLTQLTSLLNNSVVTTGLHGEGNTITTELNNNTPFTDFLAPQSGGGGSMPKAYLNILFFDEQFRFVSQNSEIIQVETKGSGQTIYRVLGEAKEAVKNGYAYVYVNNESNNFVYFDNLQVTHERGPITEDDAYYPFGLIQAGISSKALAFGEPENKKKYNGIEKEDDLQIEVYDAQFRELDAQTARWWQIDPVTDGYENISPYASMYDNPITYSDPLGDEAEDCCGGLIDAIVQVGKDVVTFAVGAGNAFATNQVGGAGRGDPNSYSDSHDAAVSQSGQTFGDLLTIGGSIAISAASVVVEGGTLGLASPAVIPLNIQQWTVATPTAIRNLSNDLSGNNKVNSSSNSSSGKSNQPGSYTNTHESGKTYSGKGSQQRAETSAKQKAAQNNDPVKKTNWTPSKNNREAFKAEAKRIQKNGGANNPPKNYNKINSPGKKYLEEDKKGN